MLSRLLPEREVCTVSHLLSPLNICIVKKGRCVEIKDNIRGHISYDRVCGPSVRSDQDHKSFVTRCLDPGFT